MRIHFEGEGFSLHSIFTSQQQQRKQQQRQWSFDVIGSMSFALYVVRYLHLRSYLSPHLRNGIKMLKSKTDAAYIIVILVRVSVFNISKLHK